MENQAGAAIACRVIQVGDTSGGKASQDLRIVGLPVTIIAFADHGIRERVQGSRFRRACAPVEITGILFENGGKDRVSEEVANREVAERSPIAFCISLRALSISREFIARLLDTCNGASEDEIDGIDGQPSRQMEFLLGCQGRRIGDIGHIEIRDNAKHALFHFIVHLLLRDFDRR